MRSDLVINTVKTLVVQEEIKVKHCLIETPLLVSSLGPAAYL